MSLTRDTYIRQPSPLQADLLAVFDRSAPLVILDCGSCEGEDSVRYSRLYPNATVYAMEPLPANVRLIEANLTRYGCRNVRIVERAFSDVREQAAFFVSSGRPPGVPASTDWDYGNKSSSLLPPDQHLEVHPWVRFDEVIEIETDTLAAFSAGEGIAEIDLLHLDVQGAELKVLGGAGDLLDQTRLVWMEVERVPLYQGQPLAGEIEAFMSAHGFVKARERVGEVAGDQLYWNAKMLGPYSLSRRLRRRLQLVRGFGTLG